MENTLRTEVATEPSQTFLFQNLFYRAALHDTVRTKWSVCHSNGIVPVA